MRAAPSPDKPGWRFWLRSGTHLRAPFQGQEPAGPVVDAECEHVPRWADCLCGLHYLAQVDDWFDYPHFKWWLRPETLASLDLSCPEDRAAFLTVRSMPFAVTFGMAEGTFGTDAHTFNAGVEHTPGKTLRAKRYRILAVLSATASVGDECGLRERYRCPVIVRDVSFERCRQVEAALTPALERV
jgi:hypothetical protein